MKKIIINKKYFVGILFVFLLLGIFSPFGSNSVFAQSCPNMTSVSGTTVNFVGELTDMGGDSTVLAWFEYGQTSSYGHISPQKSLSNLGIYCITVSGLNPCATYHYRAVAKNSSGVSYGENKTFTTSCGPTVNLTVNSSEGPINVAYGDFVTLSWISNNSNSCQASGDWSGLKATFGSQPIYNITAPKNFSITCTGPGGSASDNAIVYVNTPSLNASFSASPSNGCSPLNGVDLTASVSGHSGDNFTYYFDCTNDGLWEKIITISSPSYTAYDVCAFNIPGNYTAKTKIETAGTSVQKTTSINVRNCQTNVATAPVLSVEKWSLNLSKRGQWEDSVNAEPYEIVSFYIEVKALDSSFQNVVVKDILPEKMTYIPGSLKIDGVLASGDIFSGLNLGALSAGQKKVITFNAQLAGAESFSFGDTPLINSVSVSSSNATTSVSATAAVIVNKRSVAGAATVAGATTISTGLTNNLFIDSFLIPMLIAGLLVWFFKSGIIKWEQWLDNRKKEYYEYKVNKLLQRRINDIRAEEWNKRTA